MCAGDVNACEVSTLLLTLKFPPCYLPSGRPFPATRAQAARGRWAWAG